MRTLRLRLCPLAELGAESALDYEVLDDARAIVRRERAVLAELPRLPRTELVVAAPDVLLVDVSLPALAGARLRAALPSLAEPSGPSLVLPVRYERTAEGLVRRTPGGAVLLLPGVARLAIRIFAGGFWVEPGREQPARPIARATALEIALEDRNGARYVKVIAL